MSKRREPGTAALYRLEAGQPIRSVVTDATLSNGIGWSPAADRMYFIDSTGQRIDVFDFDVGPGLLDSRRQPDRPRPVFRHERRFCFRPIPIVRARWATGTSAPAPDVCFRHDPATSRAAITWPLSKCSATPCLTSPRPGSSKTAAHAADTEACNESAASTMSAL
jgi:hypothetical protein